MIKVSKKHNEANRHREVMQIHTVLKKGIKAKILKITLVNYECKELHVPVFNNLDLVD